MTVDENSPEQWVFIKGTNGQYMINNRANVVKLVNGKPIPVSAYRSGQRIRVKIAYRTCAVHNLLADAYLPRKKGYTIVRFKDANSGNVVLSNLEWITRGQLRKKTHKHSTLPPVVRQIHRPATVEVLPRIEEWAKQGLPVKYMAYMSSLSEATVRGIIKQYQYAKTTGFPSRAT